MRDRYPSYDRGEDFFGGQGGNSFFDSLYGAGPGIAQGLFGHSDRPYKKAEQSFKDYLQQGQLYQAPFYAAGFGALPEFQEWLKNQKDPSQFINDLMGKYQESPWAKYQQQQAIRSAQNSGSASGLTGSSALAQFMEQNARDISSQDMNQWLQNVLGINTQYGQGQERLLRGGQQSANAIGNLLSGFGSDIGGAEYGRAAGRESDRNSLWGGLFNLGASALPLLL